MTHIDEGTILAVRDEGSVARAASTHLGECEMCGEALERAEARSKHISEALGALDDPVDGARAKALVRARLDRLRTERRAPAWRRWPLGRAAAILLLTAGAATALPWSPLRSWWTARDGEPAAPVEEAEPPGQEGALRGIGIEAVDGRVHVTVRGAAAGTEIDVTWVDGGTARVIAPAGSSFFYAEGRAEVDAAPGAVSVRLPRDATDAVLQVGGTVYLRRTTSGVATPGPLIGSSDDRMVFRVPGP